jgi:hypothetical protein
METVRWPIVFRRPIHWPQRIQIGQMVMMATSRWMHGEKSMATPDKGQRGMQISEKPCHNEETLLRSERRGFLKYKSTFSSQNSHL